MKTLAFAAVFSVAAVALSPAVYAEQSCNAAAADKKLAGAAKASFTKKCVSDAVGSP